MAVSAQARKRFRLMLQSITDADDIHTFLTLDSYRILTLTDHSPGRYRLHVTCTYFPNPAEAGTYDQVFSLVKMDRIDGNSEN